MRSPTLAALMMLVFILAGCRAKSARYFVLPAAPHYLLQSPDRQTRAFPETVSSFSNAFEGWVDLRPGMTLKLERAYFKPPESRRIQDYVGLESVRFRSEPSGALRRVEYSPLSVRPEGQPPVAAAIPAAQLLARYHKFYFQVVLRKESVAANAVLISGDSAGAIVMHSDGPLRVDDHTASSQPGVHFVAFPTGTTASLSFDIVANGKTLEVLWGSNVVDVVGATRPFKLSRNYRGRKVPVELDMADANALRLPLLPGDALTF